VMEEEKKLILLRKRGGEGGKRRYKKGKSRKRYGECFHFGQRVWEAMKCLPYLTHLETQHNVQVHPRQ
jgi:hypothetical protein